MADALLSTPVAVVADAIAVSLIIVAGKKVAKSPKENIVPLMGVLGACVFAAQMVNFSIPGTGSSGHIIGGVFLSALIGPWAAFLTLSSVLIVQCLIFADGGLMALGANILNMAAMSCLVAYPLIFRPLVRFPSSNWRLMLVSTVTSTIGLELGACLVALETHISGVTVLPFSEFFVLMTSIHFVIGVLEGIATGAILCFIQRTRPDLLIGEPSEHAHRSISKVTMILGALAFLIGGGLSYFASSNPDGLEWSIAKVTGVAQLNTTTTLAAASEKLQAATAFMPDYENTFSGIVGTVIVLVMLWAICSLLRHHVKTGAQDGRH